VRRWPTSWPERATRLVPLALVPVGLILGLLAERAGYDWEDPRHWVPDLVVGLTFFAAGAVVVTRRPGTGWLLTATGAAWFVGNFDSRLAYLHRGPLVHLIVAYVGWRARTRLELVAVIVGYAAIVDTSVWGNDAASIVLVTGLVAVVALSMATATGRARLERRAALEAALVFAISVSAYAIVTNIWPNETDTMLLAYEAGLCAIAVLLAARLTVPSTSEVADLVIELGDAPSGSLRDALAYALGDPTVEVGYWSTDGCYRDQAETTLTLPAAGSGRAATFVERQSNPFAVIVHDASVLDEPPVAAAVATATRLSAANAALGAEVRTQVDALAASRRRLLKAADSQRRRLEVRLHDGPERTITNLTTALADVLEDDGGHVRRAQHQLELTLVDLRDIARGLHPRELDAGLAVALRTLAERCPVEVDVRCDPSVVSPDDVTVAAYYTCAEALANVAKHAHASSVTFDVTTRDDRLFVSVTDDGLGDADPTQGSGLRGLTDRIEALGGSLTVTSPPGGPTRLAAELPLGRQVIA